MRKKSSNREKLLKFEADGREFAKIFRATFSHSRSEQFLKQNAFLTCSWRFLKPNMLEQLELKLEKIEIYRKS